MFTCCPQCATVFRVTANQLRAARGDVRCGNCAHVFNAMESLADELPPLTEDEATPVESPAGDDELEFDAPEQTWSEIFIEAPPKPGDVALDGDLEAITADPEEWRSMLAELGVEPGDLSGAPTEADEGIEVAGASLLAGEKDQPLVTGADADEALLPDDAEAQVMPESVYVVGDAEPPAANDAEVAATTGAEMPADALASIVPDGADNVSPSEATVLDGAAGAAAAARPGDTDLPPWNELEAEEAVDAPARRGVAKWAVAAALLAIVLAGQLVHLARDSLAAHPRYGELVRSTYARLGQRLYPTWTLDSFYIRRSEALAGGSAPDALDITAAVEVTGAQAVGLPLVRVTLRDQWANTVGRRVFLPEEYLAAELPEVVAPGTRIPVALSLADPGTAARGYEVDLCLQRRRTGLECQLAERPFRP